MAGIASLEDFVNEFKELYISKRHSDVQLKVIEDDEVTQVINANSIVLEMNSTYFRNLLKDHKQGNIEFEIQLKTGQSKYMEMLISGFYNKELLNDLSMSDVLCVLKLAIVYTNDEYLKYILKLLEDMEIDCNMSRTTLTKIYLLEQEGNLNVELTKNVKARCTKFLSKLFSPIEEKHEGFFELEYASFLYLLQSDEVFSLSENSLLFFIILWLEYDITRQKGSVIERLLNTLHIKFLSFD